MVEYQCSECKENMIEQSNGYLCPRCGQLDQFEEVSSEEQHTQCMGRSKPRGSFRLSCPDRSNVRRGQRRKRQGSQADSPIVYGKTQKNRGGQSSWKV